MSPPTDRPAQAANSACRAPAYSSRLRRPSERLPEPVSGAEQEALAVDTKAWQVAIHTVASVLTLLLVALLENAGRRSAESAQEKLNVIAEALAA